MNSSIPSVSPVCAGAQWRIFFHTPTTRALNGSKTGGAGVNEVGAKFERFGWGPVANHAHDLGIDLLVQARDARRFDCGLIVGVKSRRDPVGSRTKKSMVTELSPDGGITSPTRLVSMTGSPTGCRMCSSCTTWTGPCRFGARHRRSGHRNWQGCKVLVPT